MARSRAGILSLVTALAVFAVTLLGCGSSDSALTRERDAVTSYLAAIEPLRLAVNRLLEGADPILSGAHRGALSPQLAGRRMEALERRFAAYAADVNAIAPTAATLRGLQASYAHTYILEDSYLSALVVGLGEIAPSPDGS